MADASELRQRVVDGANRIMEAVAEDVLRELIDSWNSVVRDHTGNPHLEDTKFSQQVSDDPRISWRVGFTAPQGEWLDEGVAPHGLGEIGTIRHWVTTAGEDVFRKYTGWQVELPARPWFHVRLDEIWPEVVARNFDAAGW
jgi:hypothetical protein